MYKVYQYCNEWPSFVCKTRCLVASGMVDLLVLEVNAEKTVCLLTEENAGQIVCMLTCGRQNHNKNTASKSSDNVSKFEDLQKH